MMLRVSSVIKEGVNIDVYSVGFSMVIDPSVPLSTVTSEPSNQIGDSENVKETVGVSPSLIV